jgi:hypothetical protein
MGPSVHLPGATLLGGRHGTRNWFVEGLLGWGIRDNDGGVVC